MRTNSSLISKHAISPSKFLVQIRNGTFYRQHPSALQQHSSPLNPPLFPNLTFELPAKPTQQYWAVLGNSGVTTLLEVLQGKHFCTPPAARTFPYLSSDEIEEKDHRLQTPSRAIQYVGFNGDNTQRQNSGIRGAYLSARYESHREETDWSVLQYLKGETDLNPAEEQTGKDSEDATLLANVIRDLRMEKLASMPICNLSNGQIRRARIARALLGKPELLLLDDPFMGLDPPSLVTLSPILRELAHKAAPRLILGLRPQDPIPDWITHLIILGTSNTISLMGEKAEVLFRVHRWADLHEDIDTGKENLGIIMARVLSRLYGPPLHEVGHSLTSTGIVAYDTYAKAKASNCFLNKGIMFSYALDSASRERKWNALQETWAGETMASLAQKSAQQPELFSQSALLDATVLLPKSTREKNNNSVTTSTLGSGELDIDTRVESSAPPVETIPRTKGAGDPLIELSSVIIKYGEKIVLGYPPPQKGYSEPGLNLTLRQGSRLALLGPNGSGKTTLLSLLTSDHPHSYSLPIKFFGRSRLPTVGTPGLSLFEIQSRIGHSSPEIHAFFPKTLSIRQTLESAWAETFSAKPRLTNAADEIVDVFLKWWEPELRPDISISSTSTTQQPPVRQTYMPPNPQARYLVGRRAMWRLMKQCIPCPIYPIAPWFPTPPDENNPAISDPDLKWAEITRFCDLPFNMQRLLLLLRAMVNQPDILVLDEAFSGLSSDVRNKAMLWLEHGQTRYEIRKVFNNTQRKVKRRWEIRVMENQRHLFDAMCRELDMAEEELMKNWASAKPPNALLRRIRGIREDGDLASVAAAWKVDKGKTYRFSGLKDSQAMVVVSHVKEEIPGLVDQWMRLPSEEEALEKGRGVEMGDCPGGEIRTVEGWNRVWGLR